MDSFLRPLTRIDDEIWKQKLVLCDLYYQRNSVTSIFRLPTEITQIIFIHCLHRECDHNSSHPRSVPCWVNVSYVCRHWRNVALDCPDLWAYHFDSSLRWTEELLARSKRSSLKIFLGYSSDRCRYPRRDIIEKVMNQVERIEELELILSDNIVRRVFSRLSSPAPRLRSLQIEGSVSMYPSVLFHGDTPALRTLELGWGCQIPWYSLKISGLTALRLVNVPESVRQNVEDFVVMLHCMPSLARLHLRHTLNSATNFLSSPAFHSFHKINLSCLSDLSVSEPLSIVIALLSSVDFPSKTQVRLDCDSEANSSRDHYALLTSILAQKFGTSEDQTLSGSASRSAVIKFFTFAHLTGVDLTTWECDCDPLMECQCDAITFQVAFLFNPEKIRHHGDYLIGHICCSLPRMNVQNIHVIWPPRSPTIWSRVLKHLQNLRRITLSYGHIPDLSALSGADLILHEDSDDQDGCTANDWQEQGHMLVPALEALHLIHIIFAARSTSNTTRRVNPAFTYHHLLHTLSTRNSPKGSLCLTECQIGHVDELSLHQSWGDIDAETVGK